LDDTAASGAEFSAHLKRRPQDTIVGSLQETLIEGSINTETAQRPGFLKFNGEIVAKNDTDLMIDNEYYAYYLNTVINIHHGESPEATILFVGCKLDYQVKTLTY